MSLRLALGPLLLLATPLALAQGHDSFNQSTLGRAAVLPVLGQGAVLAEDTVESGVTLDWSNEFFQRSTSREDLTLDGESLRATLRYRRGTGDGLEWSVELPLLFTGGGVMDSAIEHWHSAFGLPNSNRGEAPRDRYRIRYVRDGVTLVDLDKGSGGVGDLRLGAGFQLGEGLTLRALTQLPTGSKSQLSGGHAGAALWMDWNLPLGDGGRASLTLSGGGSMADKGGPLAAQQKNLAALGGAALVVPLFGVVDGVVQVNGHTALYRGSDLAPLSRMALPLTIGLRWPLHGLLFDLAFSEDPSVEASPDFGLLFSVRMSSD